MSNQPNDNPVLDQDFDLEKEIASWNFGDDFEGEDGEGNFLEGLIESEKARWAEKIWPVVRGIDFVKRPVTPAKAYVEDFLYAGCLSALIADAKAGKTTLTWAMIRAMLHGDVFLGKPTKRGKVLYISEQGEISFRHQLQRRCPEGWYEQILGNPEFYMILPEDHKLKDVLSQTVDASGWEQRYRIWRKAVETIQPDVLVLDTFGQYADLPANGENDNATINNRLFALKQLRTIRPTLSILVLHHTTKLRSANGQYINLRDIRGGSAFAGALDHAVMLNKLEKHHLSTRRYLHTEGRMTEERKFAVDWIKSGEYVEADEAADDKVDVYRAIADAVSKEPELMDLSIREMVDELQKRGISAKKHHVERFKKCREQDYSMPKVGPTV